MEIPFINLQAQLNPIRTEIDDAVRQVFDACSFIGGPAVENFQVDAAQYLGVKHALGCGNGSDALYIALLALGCGPGDEVITVPYTYIATPEAIRRTGATVVFCDVEPVAYTMDPAKLKALITPKTRAILPVHIFGQSVNFEAIKQVAGAIPIIEDSAQAWGATRHGIKVGSLGTISCFSFYPTKTLGASGDGGLITTNDDELAEAMLSITLHGQSKERYYNDRAGINSRLDAVQAAILGLKLKYVDTWNAERAVIAEYYTGRFAHTSVEISKVLSGNTHVWHQCVILVQQRDQLVAHLRGKGIGCGVYYPMPQHLQTCFLDLGYKAGEFPETEGVCQRCLSLPCWPEMTQAQRQLVADEVVAFVR
ncbi:MAG: aminotransferase class I/II-fold pyridoxal phosphate-dependent enzyme [Candidatus Latescibacteria bacterium]|nr:aminotransferase class I/II-fold pyridoxal phosphate-dependent enzyme [Candidatus Latescibacterota bacterium]